MKLFRMFEIQGVSHVCSDCFFSKSWQLCGRSVVSSSHMLDCQRRSYPCRDTVSVYLTRYLLLGGLTARPVLGRNLPSNPCVNPTTSEQRMLLLTYIICSPYIIAHHISYAPHIDHLYYCSSLLLYTSITKSLNKSITGFLNHISLVSNLSKCCYQHITPQCSCSNIDVLIAEMQQQKQPQQMLTMQVSLQLCQTCQDNGQRGLSIFVNQI